MKKASGLPVDSRIRLMITGNNMDKIGGLNQIVNTAGGNIVADYTCLGGMPIRKKTGIPCPNHQEY